ncbi:helix-turn-helix domain-containing protein [Pasteurella multocida]
MSLRNIAKICVSLDCTPNDIMNIEKGE